MSRYNSSEKGSMMLEFALTVALFLVMLFGIVDFGRALYTYHFLSNAAREATRYAAVRGSTCGDDGSCATSNSASGTAGPTTLTDIQDYVTSITPPGIGSSQITTTACGIQGGTKCADSTPAFCATTSNEPGCTVQVKVSYPFGFLVPLVHSGSITLSSTSEMIISH
jgi:Flp pilus assembly protein TadG